ncbi:MAG: M15 family metallopeptidase [Saccharofermentanales bacterium]
MRKFISISFITLFIVIALSACYFNNGGQKSSSIPSSLSTVISTTSASGSESASASSFSSSVILSPTLAPTVTKKPFEIIFTKSAVPDSIYKNMLGKTIHDDSIMKIENLSYITLTFYGYDGRFHIGQIIMDETLADEIIEIFKILLDAKFPIQKIVLPDAYGGDDELSMRDNNTSGFNDRPIKNSGGALSYHQLGRAIDINPLYNPYINLKTGDIQPSTAGAYLDRTKDLKGMIHSGDICVTAFKTRGWVWGGDWTTVKDYQHFEKAE